MLRRYLRTFNHLETAWDVLWPRDHEAEPVPGAEGGRAAGIGRTVPSRYWSHVPSGKGAATGAAEAALLAGAAVERAGPAPSGADEAEAALPYGSQFDGLQDHPLSGECQDDVAQLHQLPCDMLVRLPWALIGFRVRWRPGTKMSTGVGRLS